MDPSNKEVRDQLQAYWDENMKVAKVCAVGAPKPFLTKMLELQNMEKTIECVAIGENGSYFISDSDGNAYWACIGTAFTEKVNSIEIRKIRQVTFGPQGTYAIVMENGFCHHRTFGKDCGIEGPWQKIEEWQNHIQSVAMTSNRKEWIVVGDRDGWSSYGIREKMVEVIKKASGTTTPALKCCQLGKDAGSWLVQTRAGQYTYLMRSQKDHQHFKSLASTSLVRAFWEQ